MTLPVFVDYLAGLSAVAVILVYVLTTSQQLDVINKQIAEMQYSRNVQVQPLLYFDRMSVEFDPPRFYKGPFDGFRKLHFLCRIRFSFNFSNIGNGPAVGIDFFPNLVSVSSEGKLNTLVETVGERIECISLREKDSKEIFFMFLDEKHRFIETILSQPVALELTILLKNALGMPFRENIRFEIFRALTASEDKFLKSCLKAVRTTEIDFVQQAKRFEELVKLGKDEEATRLMENLNEQLKGTLGDIQTIKLPVGVMSGSFSVMPMSESDYSKSLKDLKEQREIQYRELERIHYRRRRN